MASSYTFPSGQIAARSVAVIPYDGSLLVPHIAKTSIFQQIGNTFTPLALTIAPTGIQGWSCAAIDASGNAYVAPYASGQLLSLPSGNPASATLTALAAGKSWTGVAVPTAGVGNSIPYVLASDGTMQALISGTMQAVAPGFGALARCLTTDGTKLYTTLPATGHIGTLTLSTLTSGAITTTATPMATPSCIAAGPTGVAVGGWSASTIPFTNLVNAMAASPAAPSTTAAAVSAAGNAIIMITGVEPSWSQTQRLGSTGAPTALAWTPNGEQVLTADPTNGNVEVFNLTGLTLASFQTLTVSDANGIAVTPDSNWGFVPQPTPGSITVLQNITNTWSINQTVTGLTSPTSVLATGTQEFVAGVSGGLTWFSYGSAWTQETAVTGLGFTPTALATDGQGTVFSVGASGASGILTAVTKAGVVATTSWTGSGNAVLWSTGQIMVVDTTSDLIRGFTIAKGVLTQIATTAAPSGCDNIAVTESSVWLCGNAVINQMLFTAPCTLAPRDSGSVSVLTGGTFYTATLGTEHKPSAITWDVLGNVWCATIDGVLFQISAAGAILSQATIVPYGSQPAGTPIGISSLLWNNGNLFASSSLCGALIQVM